MSSPGSQDPGRATIFPAQCYSSWDRSPSSQLRSTHLQPIDQLLLDGVLGGGVGGHAQPLGRLPQALLLVLVLRVGRGSLVGWKERTPLSPNGFPRTFTVACLLLLNSRMSDPFFPISRAQYIPHIEKALPVKERMVLSSLLKATITSQQESPRALCQSLHPNKSTRANSIERLPFLLFPFSLA